MPEQISLAFTSKRRHTSMAPFKKIRLAGVKPSVVINPGTPVESIQHILNLVDQVLVMTVNPGFGGQAFLPETMDKIRQLVQLREEKGLDFDIEVDGGIDDKTIHAAKEAGANVFVAGSYVFNGDVNERVPNPSSSHPRLRLRL